MTYPNLGFDPAPGDTAAVARLVFTLRSVGAEVTGVRTELHGIGRANSSWVGQSATAFTGALGELPKYLDKASDSTSAALRALDSWLQELGDFQRRARIYEDRAAEARRRIASVRAAVDALPAVGPGMTDQQVGELHDRTVAAHRAVGEADGELQAVIGEAQRMLDDHRSRSDEVGRLVRQAADDAPPEPGFFDKIMDGLQAVGDFFVGFGQMIADFIEEHADLFKQIGDVLADLAMVVGVIALFVAGGPILWAALALSAAALAFHATAMAGGADVTWETLALDGLGVVSAAAGLKGLSMVRAGRAAKAGTSLWRPSQWGTRIQANLTIAGGKVSQWSGNAFTVGGTAESVRLKVRDEAFGVRSIPGVSPTAGIVDHFIDDAPAAAGGPAPVNSAGEAFAGAVAANRSQSRVTVPVG